MSIGRIYREYIQERIIKSFLTQGITPTKVEIDERLEEALNANPSLSAPFISIGDFEIKESEESSASKVNNIINTTYDDLSVAYKALANQAASITSTYDSVLSELNSVEKIIADLEERSANLLLLAEDSSGSLDFVSDTFKDKSKADLVNSTALVDNTSRQVTLSPNTQTRIPMVLAESDVQFNVITRNDFVSTTLAPNSSLLNAFSDLENIWLQRVEMRRGVGSVTAELVVRMPTASTEVSKIILYPGASGEGNIATVTVQYSNDGLNWFNVDGQDTVRLNRTVSMAFSSTAASYWKFVFNKAGYDEYVGDSYLYEFGVKNIQFYGVEYSVSENELSNVFYSAALAPQSGEEFNKVSLSVCEVLPKDTDIQYAIAGLTETDLLNYGQGSITLNDLPFIDIDPIEREQKNNQTIIDFSRVDTEVGHTSSYQVGNAIDFNYKNPVNLMLDYTLPPGVVKNEMRVLRNVGDNTISNQPPQPVTVKNIDNGWAFDGRDYSCRFYVEQSSGIVLAFGETSAFIDGVRVTGRVNITQGYHSFRTSKENWRTVNPDDIVPPGDESPDALYPYNHKYMIEGLSDFLYGVDLDVTVSGKTKKEIIDPDQIYQGVTRYWERTLEEVTTFDYVSNISDTNYNIFSFINDSNGQERLAVKHSPQPGLLEDEKFAIITRSVNGDLFKAVVLRANLSSLDPKVTPLIDEYIIKLGY
jgi:hypothetical protein